MKKFISSVVVMILMLNSIAYSNSEEIKVYYEGELIQFDVSPKIINDRTMVPFRKVFEKLGANVMWDENERRVTANKGSINIILKIGNPRAFVNDIECNLDSEPIIVNGRTLVPLRFISENLGENVIWEELTRSIFISHINVKIEKPKSEHSEIATNTLVDKVEESNNNNTSQNNDDNKTIPTATKVEVTPLPTENNSSHNEGSNEQTPTITPTPTVTPTPIITATATQTEIITATPAPTIIPTPIPTPPITPTPTTENIVSGYVENTEIKKNTGKNSIVVDNLNGPNSIRIRLISSNEIVREFYVKSYDKFTITDLDSGEYELIFKDLNTNESFKASEKILFQEGGAYECTIVLYDVQDGNLEMYPADWN